MKKTVAVLLLLAMLMSLLYGCSSKEEPAESGYAAFEDLAGKKIGVVTGSVFDEVAKEHIPNVSVEYFNVEPDLPVALEKDKIEAYIVDQPVFSLFSRSYPDQYVIKQISEEDYAYIFPKDSEQHEKICRELNDFLSGLWEDGTLDEIRGIWLGGNADSTQVDYDSLTGENGTLHYATCTESGATFDMLADGKYAGYDVDILTRFCREYGYALEIEDYSFSGLIAAVSAGKADIGACAITITEERKESMLFSEPNYHGGTLLVAKHGGSAAMKKYTSAANLAGKHIGVVTGSILDIVAQNYISDPQLEYLNAMSDVSVALESGKIDAYVADEPIYRSIARTHPDEYIIEQLTFEDYAFLFPKNSEKHAKICSELNEFLAGIREDGTMQELMEKWIDGDYTQASINFDGLSGENGTLKMGVSSEIGAPFTFMNNGVFSGYDVEVAVRFCRAYGYALEFTDYNVGGLLTAISTGKADLAAGCVSVTPERQETILFSDPDYVGGIVLVGSSAASSAAAASEEGSGSGIAASFEKTFIREGRWKLFVSGIGVTLLITALSTVFGTVLGFGIYMIYRKNIKPFNVAVNILVDILEKTPVVVILMILYYVIFGKTDLSGMWVAVVGFSVMFACSFVGTLKVGVMAVDKGQTEASLSLGFTDRRGFLRVILPQAAKHFLPNYKGQIVSLLKDTAIVGYIAVQDLTKVGDIVRSRTYEAFFPLVATAIIYFLLAWLLTLLVRRIEFRTDPTKRSRESILKGVQTK